MRKILKNIETFINQHAHDRVLEKGRNIAKTLDRFGTPSIDLENDEATFRIMGTRFYTVTINKFTDNIASDCTCPYDWGGICKHQVGALLYLKQHLESSGSLLRSQKSFKPSAPVARRIKKRKASDPFLLQNYNPLTYNWLNKQIDHYMMHRAHQFSLEHVKLNGRTVSFIAAEKVAYYRKKSEQHSITFTETENGLKTSCSCGQVVDNLCPHQVAILSTIMNIYGEDFFKVLDPAYIKKQKEEVTLMTGIPIDRVSEYFDFKVATQKFEANKQANGLMSFNPVKEKFTTEQMETILKKEKLQLEVPLLDNEKATHLAYIFTFSNPLVLKLTPITGVPDGLNAFKYIKEYISTNPPLQIDDIDEQVLGIIAELDDFNAEYHNSKGELKTEADINAQKFYHKKLTKIFELFQNEKPAFYRIGDSLEKIKKSGLTFVKLSPKKAILSFEMGEEDLFFFLKSKLTIGDELIDLSLLEDKDLAQVFPFYGMVRWNGYLYQHHNLIQAQASYELARVTPVLKIVKKDFAAFFRSVITPLSESFHIDSSSMTQIAQNSIQLSPNEKQLYITELANFIIFKPIVQYDHNIQANPRINNSIVAYDSETITTYKRDEEYEKAFESFLVTLHPEFESQLFGEFFFLPFTELKRNNWFFNIFEKITEAQINVFGINELKTIQYSPFKANINTHIKSGQDWFDVSIELSFGEENVKLSDLRKAIMRQERFVPLSNGKLGVLPEEWFEKLSKFFRVGEIEKGELKISKLKFSIVDELFDEIDDEQILAELREKKRKLLHFEDIKKIELPQNITANLRDYQVAGYNWLNFLNEFGWGGILADDMGLGKTVQILCFLQQQVNNNRSCNLIVVPTTLLFNWQNEIKKFTPELSYLIHHGSDRSPNLRNYRDYDLIITTYGLMFNDIEIFKNIPFNYAVLDESQAIKNPTSKRYKAACILNAKNKIAMTGTPIENNTFDLYAQINFLNPGFLGSQQSFKAEFSKPIDTEGDGDRAMELQKLIKPFVLRRTKEQVATELPPKVEDYIYCEMEPTQRKIYEGYRNKYRDYLLKKIEEDGLQRSKLYVLEGLLKLRQICDSPEILSDQEDYGKESIKIKELLNHITEKTGNHKILIFSQFVRMLKVIERELSNNAIIYEYLDGQSSTKNRQKSVENFQTNDACRVFLISLKAGGTGLNLTAADYVYIVDPWWNPAVENQAIDRTHRIGQDKHIIAYRMICKDTIEEKIMKLQAKKMKIAQDIINTDEGFMKKLNREDIMELFN